MSMALELNIIFHCGQPGVPN